MSDKPFKDAVYLRTDDLPDHYRQEIVDLTEKILVNVLYDHKKKQERDPNIALSALQRSLGLVIAKVFPKSELQRILDGCYQALVDSANEWSDGEDAR